MSEEMGNKPFVNQKCMNLHTDPWITRSNLQFDTFEEAQAAFEGLTPQSVYRIAEAIPSMALRTGTPGTKTDHVVKYRA